MESAEVDDVEDAVNLDDNGWFGMYESRSDLVVMDADDFIQRAEDARFALASCLTPSERREPGNERGREQR